MSIENDELVCRLHSMYTSSMSRSILKPKFRKFHYIKEVAETLHYVSRTKIKCNGRKLVADGPVGNFVIPHKFVFKDVNPFVPFAQRISPVDEVQTELMYEDFHFEKV